jgi:hypothetical protein
MADKKSGMRCIICLKIVTSLNEKKKLTASNITKYGEKMSTQSTGVMMQAKILSDNTRIIRN